MSGRISKSRGHFGSNQGRRPRKSKERRSEDQGPPSTASTPSQASRVTNETCAICKRQSEGKENWTDVNDLRYCPTCSEPHSARASTGALASEKDEGEQPTPDASSLRESEADVPDDVNLAQSTHGSQTPSDVADSRRGLDDLGQPTGDHVSGCLNPQGEIMLAGLGQGEIVLRGNDSYTENTERDVSEAWLGFNLAGAEETDLDESLLDTV